MRPTKIISGGQTGADLGGLVGARRAGIATGGTAPLHYRTEAGRQRRVLRGFGLVEHPSYRYLPRTECNVRDSDATVIFGNTGSPGCQATVAFCRSLGKPFLANPLPTELRRWVEANQFSVLNVAGNRESTTPGLAKQVATLIFEAFRIKEAG
jgi:hypothetical protein